MHICCPERLLPQPPVKERCLCSEEYDKRALDQEETFHFISCIYMLLRDKQYYSGCIILKALLDFSLSVKAALHECVIRTSQP